MYSAVLLNDSNVLVTFPLRPYRPFHLPAAAFTFQGYPFS